ncbi:2-oxoglutarate (2OG) and Fe(II)-dependent oxygenase superfamily protein [Quillaja saponaria]|uniref:2-oxoglutarate (2OG) and Fe(II)-dependent oxygenase superfamily protein n=1 Tax=Quillaja saponaria TaxID=32244 RepID=A0AAD7P5A7_QUISA|nr:2-oxoglutarate (2OG) and Fe(II)-dependent oxygenase superfamily protein [Quillaja saponaria]
MPIIPFEKLKDKLEEFFGCEYELFVEFTGLIRLLGRNLEGEPWRNGKVVPLVTCRSWVRGVETASLQKCKGKTAYMCAHPLPTPQ